MSKTDNIDYKTELSKCKNMNDLTGKDGLLQRLLKNMIQELLEKEMEETLGYQKHSVKGNKSGNSRNGFNSKTVKSSLGALDLEVPRDRNGEFEPKLIKKRQTDISSFDDKIISMYARGMSTRDIQDHIEEIYGVEISPTMVSNITNKVVDVANEWQCRPLDEIYSVIFFDAIHYKVRESGAIICKAAYTCLGINLEGKKEILGIWIGESEGAKFWLNVCTELQNRGVKDILIACIDGLKGLPDAIQTIYPKVDIQLCVIHMIRNTSRYVPHKYIKEYMKDLKLVYKAATEKEAEDNLLKLQEKWEKKYPLSVTPWVNNWDNIKTFFQFPEVIRRVIYTTNAVESLHRQFRKVTKSRAVFPSNQALFKILYLTAKQIGKKWTASVRDWRTIISYFAIHYGERVNLKTIN